MKILFDHQMFSIQKYGGVSKYFCELMKNIPTDNEYRISVLLSDNHYLKEDSKIFNKISLPIPDREFKGKSFIKGFFYNVNKCYSKKIIKSDNFDVFHPTFYDTYFIERLKKPYVLTVHDLIAFKDNFDTDVYLRQKMKKTIENASRIIAISENTKKDIMNILNVPSEKIDVIYHGYNKAPLVKKANGLGRYILYVGRRAGYKNFKTFCEAVSVLMQKETDLKLVCVGQPFHSEEVHNLKRLNIFRRTVILTATEEKLGNLYANASVFVYPTLYEGFGLPILEAFANNCPICLSNTSSFPEIAGDGGIYFDPYDIESMRACIEKVIYNDAFSDEIRKKGILRLQNFSWEKTAKETINCYKKAI